MAGCGTFPKRGMMILALLAMLLLVSACASDRPSGNDVQGKASSGEEPVELLVSAAASLKDSMEEAGRLFEEQHPHIRIRYNFGGSGSLGQQLGQGAPVDLFVSAAVEPMDRLVDKGMVKAGSVQLMFRNSLVLIEPGPEPSIKQLDELLRPDVRIVAVGQPDTVPAGEYAAEALQHEGLWNEVESKAVYGKDVSQVLAYVESGNADAGFVYKTDVTHSSKAVLSLEIDPGLHQPIEYPAAVPVQAKHPEEASELLAFMKSPEVKAIFKNAGFDVVEESP